MFTIRVAEISSRAGVAADGIVRGMIAQSPFGGLCSNFEWQETLYAIRKDAVTGGYGFTDISAEAVSRVPDSCEIFGSDSTFSSAEAVYIASDDVEVSELRVVITTPGVWDGEGIAIYDSPDGISAHRQLSIISDGTNGFRNGPGTYAITWAPPPTGGMPFSPIPDDVPFRRWIVVKPVGLTRVTTAPKLSMIYALHGTNYAPFVDFTTVINRPMDDGNFADSPDGLAFINSANIITCDAPAIGISFMIYRSIPENACTGVMEYLASDNTWKQFENALDETNSFQNGPTTLGDPPQLFNVSWSLPADWSQKTLTLPLLFGGGVTKTGYQMRYRVTQVNAAAPFPPALSRGRLRMLGAGYSGGIYHYEPKTYTGVTFEVGVPSETDVIVQITNMNSGRSGVFTIPAGKYSSAEVRDQRLDLSNRIEVAVGESIIISWLSGGAVQDVELVLQ